MSLTLGTSVFIYSSSFVGRWSDSSFRTEVIYSGTTSEDNYVKLLLSHLDLPFSTISISLQFNLKPFEQIKLHLLHLLLQTFKITGFRENQ